MKYLQRYVLQELQCLFLKGKKSMLTDIEIKLFSEAK